MQEQSFAAVVELIETTIVLRALVGWESTG